MAQNTPKRDKGTFYYNKARSLYDDLLLTKDDRLTLPNDECILEMFIDETLSLNEDNYDIIEKRAIRDLE